MTRLTAAGGKGYTYVPAGGVVNARQVGSNYYGQPAVEWSHLDPVGVTESGLGGPAAYDPLGNYASLPAPPPQSGAWPQPAGYYGPIWGGAGSLTTNVNDFSSGCLSSSGAPVSCSERMREETSDNDKFWDNLPREYQGGELWRGERDYQGERDKEIFSIPIAVSDGRSRLRLPFSRSPVPGENFYGGGDQAVVNVPTLKNANAEEQKRFDAAYREMWGRLHQNNGDNDCAKLFGGLKQAEQAPRGRPRRPPAVTRPPAEPRRPREEMCIPAAMGYSPLEVSAIRRKGRGRHYSVCPIELPFAT